MSLTFCDYELDFLWLEVLRKKYFQKTNITCNTAQGIHEELQQAGYKALLAPLSEP